VPDDKRPEPRLRRDYRTSRLEAFSDGVFAIAITLLVLDLSVPASTGDGLFTAFADQWPSYLAYIVSFSTVGAVWLAHSVITEYMDRADYVFFRMNLVLLLIVGFIPFPTRLVAEYIRDEDAERVAVTIYGITLLAAAMTVALLWRYAVKHALVTDDTSDEEARALALRIVPTFASYAFFLVIGLFLPTVAVVGYLVIALAFMFPVIRLFGRRDRSRRD
jgi:uncharacterized membrane protein